MKTIKMKLNLIERRVLSW